MQPSLNPILLAGVVVAAGVAWVASMRIPAPAATATSAPLRQKQAASVLPKALALTQQAQATRMDPFWPPVEAPKPVVQPAALPTPPLPPPKPTLPFKFFGRMTNPDGREAIFVSRENDQYEIKPDVVLEGQFRVISVDPTQIVFEHIASGEKLELLLPAAPKNNSGSGF